MIANHIRTDILSRLKATEAEHGVRVLLAVESGSRAWGFESADSDYDARFIYAHPRDWYLSVGLEEQRDVIEYPIVDEIDINGWDLRKALRLFWKSNPGFVEWIQSPITYLDRGTFASESRRLLPQVYSCVNGFYHYHSMASKTFNTHLQGDRVSLKKYFYALRPLLAARWVAKFRQAPPIEFRRLMEMLEPAAPVVAAIEALLEAKKDAPEMGLAAPDPNIHAFIEEELVKLEALRPEAVDRSPDLLPQLDLLFQSSLDEAWA